MKYVYESMKHKKSPVYRALVCVFSMRQQKKNEYQKRNFSSYWETKIVNTIKLHTYILQFIC